MIAKTTCLLAALLPLADPPEASQKSPLEMQGAWRLVAAVSETGEAEVPQPGLVIVIKQDRVLYGGEEIATILSGADAKPQEIDFHFGSKDRTCEGICAVAEEKLKICLNRRGDGLKERPDAFSVDGHPFWALITLEKIKADEIGPGTGFVGLVLRENEETKEVVVGDVLDGGPAKKAGLLPDDILLAVGGAEVTDIRQAVTGVRHARPGEELSLKIRRAGKERDQKVKVGILPISAILGIQ
jgi:uncharacterized protein (TIGR03067 family)